MSEKLTNKNNDLEGAELAVGSGSFKGSAIGVNVNSETNEGEETSNKMISISLPTDLLERIDQYQTKEVLSTRKKAVIELMEKSLDISDNRSAVAEKGNEHTFIHHLEQLTASLGYSLVPIEQLTTSLGDSLAPIEQLTASLGDSLPNVSSEVNEETTPTINGTNIVEQTRSVRVGQYNTVLTALGSLSNKLMEAIGQGDENGCASFTGNEIKQISQLLTTANEIYHNIAPYRERMKDEGYKTLAEMCEVAYTQM